jgi:hypothetical protein
MLKYKKTFLKCFFLIDAELGGDIEKKIYST